MEINENFHQKSNFVNENSDEYFHSIVDEKSEIKNKAEPSNSMLDSIPKIDFERIFGVKEIKLEDIENEGIDSIIDKSVCSS